MALDTVRTNKLRSGLTILGIVIGVTTVITISSLISGLNKSVQDWVNALGSNVLWIYHMPVIGVRPTTEMLARKKLTVDDALAMRNLPHVVAANAGVRHVNQIFQVGIIGIKYGLADAGRLAKVARDAGIDRFVWLAGAAELAAPSLWSAGARGFTSGLANITTQIPLAMLQALRDNDFEAAMKAWEQARRFEELRAANASADNVSVVKEAMHQLGLCRPDVRPPSRLLPHDIKDEISGILASWGVTR